MIEYADIVADLSWGDTGKGKVTSALVKDGEYDFVCRWAGGNNAGHTVFVDGKKYKPALNSDRLSAHSRHDRQLFMHLKNEQPSS